MHIDIVIPQKNEEEYIQMAQTLGWDGLCFFYPNKPDALRLGGVKSKMPIYHASPSDSHANLIIKESKGDDRDTIEAGGFQLLYDIEKKQKHDSMHQRQSGLNHIYCNIMVKKKIGLAFPFETILGLEVSRRGVILGRMRQNFGLCEKYGVDTAIVSMATNPYHLRSPHDLQRTYLAFGMNTSQAKRSILHVGRILEK